MLVLDVAAPASILQTAGGGSHLHEALHLEHLIPSDADMPFLDRGIGEGGRSRKTPILLPFHRMSRVHHLVKTASSHRRVFIYTTPWH